MYNIKMLAKYIVTKCQQDKKPISNLKLQFILYLIQETFLKILNKPAFMDNLEAWMFGPCVPNIYYEYCAWGAMPIQPMSKSQPRFPRTNDFNEKEIVDRIIEDNRSKPVWELTEEIQAKGNGWEQIHTEYKTQKKVIPLATIKGEKTKTKEMKNTINISCPHCGSSDMKADCTITVTGRLNKDGEIIAESYWTPINITEELIASSPENDIKGFCNHCGKECDFSWKKGFIKKSEKEK